MNCLARPIKRKFLFWTYDAYEDHKFRIVYMEKTLWWRLDYQCFYCDSKFTVNFVEDESVCQRLGVRKCPSSNPSNSCLGWFESDIKKHQKKYALKGGGDE